MRISKDDPILIIGGGLSGLMTAVTLFHHDFTQVKIYEQHADSSVEKSPVFLTSAAQEALESINMLPEVLASASPMPQMEWLWKGTKSLRKIDFEDLRVKKGYGLHICSKPELMAMIKKRLPEDWILSGQEFISYTQNEKKVEAHFSGDQHATGVLLIGADGRSSRVRLQLKGGGITQDASLVSYRAILDRNVLADANHSWLSGPCVEVLQGGQSASLVPIGERQVGLILSLSASGNTQEDAQALKSRLQSAYGNWPDPFPSAIGQTWPADFKAEQHQDMPIDKALSQGRVVLVGDAAHSAHAFLGFNDSFSLVSAGSLGAQITKEFKRVERGIERYEKERFRAAKRFQRAARKHSKLVANSNPASTFFRNLFYGSLPIGLTAKQLTRVLSE